MKERLNPAASGFGVSGLLSLSRLWRSAPLWQPSIFHMWTAPSSQGVLQCFDQIACVHMSGLFVRSHMNAGQDGFRDKSSKQKGDLIEGHCKMRNVSRRGSIDHTTCSLSCKFWHQLSTVAVELLPVSGLIFR